MASSWNKGTLVKEADAAVDLAVASASRAVQEGKSLFQSVVEDAAEKLAQGAEVVADTKDPLTTIQDTAQAAGEFVYDLLPEREDVIEDIKFTSQAITEGTTSPEALVRTVMPVIDFASPMLPINAEKFFDFMSNGGQISMTVDDFSSSDIEAVKTAARKALAEGRNKFTYDDWGFPEKSVLMRDIKTMASGTITDPNFRMATLIGQTANGNVFVNDQGELIVKDVYDFNSGPLGRKLQEALVHKEMGNMEKYRQLSQEVLLDENGDPRPYFQRLRIWAAALGAPQGSGTSWEVNFGKLD
jgi:hypothetical protein